VFCHGPITKKKILTTPLLCHPTPKGEKKSTTYIQVKCLGHGFLFKLNYNISKFWQLSKQSSKINERILINESKVWFMAMDFLSFITLDV
jgi:hypothetical protein